jgi:uncharacterized protein YneF (UPF0154 family)
MIIVPFRFLVALATICMLIGVILGVYLSMRGIR